MNKKFSIILLNSMIAYKINFMINMHKTMVLNNILKYLNLFKQLWCLN